MRDGATTQEAFLLALERRAFIYECFGVFWIVAEGLILAGVLIARRHLEHRPTAPAAAWDTTATRHVLLLGIVPLFLGIALLLRHFLLPAGSALLGGGEGLDAVAATMVARQREHLLVWSIMVVLWVVLESTIVYHGWRAYRRLVVLLPETPPPPGVRLSGVASGLLLFALVAMGPASLAWASPVSGTVSQDVIQAAFAAEEPVRSAAYLVIRAAAVAWIVVEWIAAVYLWRGLGRIRRAAEGLA